jgi:hypothetical protein
MNDIVTKITDANNQLNAIIDSFISKDKIESKHQARIDELKKQTKDDLIALVLKYETKKSDKIKVEDVIKAILEDEQCQYLSYKTIAAQLREKLNTKTSDKSIAWYPSNRSNWNVKQRTKLRLG